MIDMYISRFKECFVQLCEMLRTGQAVLISVNKCLIITLIFGQDIKGYDLQFLDTWILLYAEAGLRIGRCREDCYDLCNLQAAGGQLSREHS